MPFLPRKFKDQHGRLWFAMLDTTCNDTIGHLQPQFTAPWLPDTKSEYVRVVHDPDTGVSTVKINYAQIKGDLRYAWQEWIKHRDLIGREVQKDAYNPEKPTPYILQMAGPSPKPIEPVIAAEAGDPWVLGFSDEMPPWATPFFTKETLDETAFMKRAEERVKKGLKPKKENTALVA